MWEDVTAGSRSHGEDRLYELTDGVLVEKAVGYVESRLATVLIPFLEVFADTYDLGIVLGAEKGWIEYYKKDFETKGVVSITATTPRFP